MARVTKDLEEKLGLEEVENLIQKEWKVAELPPEEEIKGEKHKSKMARNNPNSRKNLVQYNKKTREQKEKALQNLRIVEKEEDVNPKEILGEEVDLSLIETVLPAKNILKDRTEQEIYYNVIKLFLKDFNVEELSFSDVDDIITLALNRVLEHRILRVASKSEKLVLEAAPTIEKFRKHSDKVKSNLASRRVDRVDLKSRPALSIVDLAAHLDQQDQLDFDRRIKELEQEQKDYQAPVRDSQGNLVEN